MQINYGHMDTVVWAFFIYFKFGIWLSGIMMVLMGHPVYMYESYQIKMSKYNLDIISFEANIGAFHIPFSNM